MSGVVRNKVHKKFKMRDYSLKVDALSEVLAFLSHFPSDALDDALALLLDELHHLSLKSSMFWIKSQPSSLSRYAIFLYSFGCPKQEEEAQYNQNRKKRHSTRRRAQLIIFFLTTDLSYSKITSNRQGLEELVQIINGNMQGCCQTNMHSFGTVPLALAVDDKLHLALFSPEAEHK